MRGRPRPNPAREAEPQARARAEAHGRRSRRDPCACRFEVAGPFPLSVRTAAAAEPGAPAAMPRGRMRSRSALGVPVIENPITGARGEKEEKVRR